MLPVAIIVACMILMPVHCREYPFRVMALAMVIGGAVAVLFMEIE